MVIAFFLPTRLDMEITQNIVEKLKSIASNWLGCPFLKRYKELGDFYIKQIEMEKKYESSRNE